MNNNTESVRYKDGRPLHFWADIKIFEALKGDSTTFMVYCWILRRANGHDGECFESNKSISKNLGISLSCVKRSLKVLEDKNIIKKTSRPGKTTVCVVTDASVWRGGPNMAQVISGPTGGPNMAQGGGPNMAHKENTNKEKKLSEKAKPKKSAAIATEHTHGATPCLMNLADFINAYNENRGHWKSMPLCPPTKIVEAIFCYRNNFTGSDSDFIEHFKNSIKRAQSSDSLYYRKSLTASQIFDPDRLPLLIDSWQDERPVYSEPQRSLNITEPACKPSFLWD